MWMLHQEFVGLFLICGSGVGREMYLVVGTLRAKRSMRAEYLLALTSIFNIFLA
jgi:hypothetical protein